MRLLRFKQIHKGYFIAESDLTGETYVVRTRPRNDGWMAIAADHGIVMAEGKSFDEATTICDKQDAATYSYLFNEE